MRAGLGQIGSLQPGDREPVFGAFGLEPGAGDGPVITPGLSGKNHQFALGGRAFGLLFQRGGDGVAGDGQRAVHRVGRRQAGRFGLGQRLSQQWHGARGVVLGEVGGGHGRNANPVGRCQRAGLGAATRALADALALAHRQAREAAAQGLAADALGRERRQRGQPLDEGCAGTPRAEVLAVHVVRQVHQPRQLGLGRDQRQALAQPPRHRLRIGGVIVPGLADKGVEVHALLRTFASARYGSAWSAACQATVTVPMSGVGRRGPARSGVDRRKKLRHHRA